MSVHVPRKKYESDLTSRQWQHLRHMIPAAKKGGRPRTQSTRTILNAIFYVLRSGCAWRLLPHDFPPWQTVYGTSHGETVSLICWRLCRIWNAQPSKNKVP